MLHTTCLWVHQVMSAPTLMSAPTHPNCWWCALQVLVIVILVPSLTVSGGLLLLSVALMRYLRYLKRSHDAIHLTEGWKRRNAPGLISDGNDRVLREVSRAAAWSSARMQQLRLCCMAVCRIPRSVACAATFPAFWTMSKVTELTDKT